MINILKSTGYTAAFLFLISTTAACGDPSEREVKRLIEVDGFEQTIPLLNSKLWTSGVVWHLSNTDQCWLPPYIKTGQHTATVEPQSISSNCPDIRGADLTQTESKQEYYASQVRLLTHTPNVRIVEMTTQHDGAVRVHYQIDSWQATETYKKWALDDPELMARYPAPQPQAGRIDLCEFQSGWKDCGRATMLDWMQGLKR